GLIHASIVTFEAVYIKPSNGPQMITFGVQIWNDAKGGMCFAFPPYGATVLAQVENLCHHLNAN
ncbi:MAG: hypothetical protein MUP25_03720, partial [Syntrophales bacterium]|nr:hypothetical protein [Syntrophales bacterium]